MAVQVHHMSIHGGRMHCWAFGSKRPLGRGQGVVCGKPAWCGVGLWLAFAGLREEGHGISSAWGVKSWLVWGVAWVGQA